MTKEEIMTLSADEIEARKSEIDQQIENDDGTLAEQDLKNLLQESRMLNKQLEEWKGTVLESSFSRNQEDGTTDYDLTVRRKKEISYAEMKDFMESHPEILSVSNSSP